MREYIERADASEAALNANYEHLVLGPSGGRGRAAPVSRNAWGALLQSSAVTKAKAPVPQLVRRLATQAPLGAGGLSTGKPTPQPPPRPELAPPAPPEVEPDLPLGDHSRGIKGSAPHFLSTYQAAAVQATNDFKVPEYGHPRKQHFHSCGVVFRENAVAIAGDVSSPSQPRGEAKQGDHSLGIHGKSDEYASTYEVAARALNWQPPERGMPRKYHSHSSPALFPEVVHANKLPKEAGHDAQSLVGSLAKPTGPALGDMSRGFRGPAARLAPMSWEVGRDIPSSVKNRSSAPVIIKNYRLTQWH